MRRVVLVVAKAPTPGLVKTRLIGPVDAAGAAALAAAAFSDTLETALAVPDSRVVVALAGEIGEQAGELTGLLAACRVVRQSAGTFGDRLCRAHHDAAVPGGVVLQIGMDTPQLTVGLLELGLDRTAECGAALGPATDGGWWSLGLADPRVAACLPRVAMSRPTTFRDTRRALLSHRRRPAILPTLTDVDTWAEVGAVVESAPTGRFAAAVALAEPTAAGVVA